MTLASALSQHWPEYLIEGWALGTFMVSAATFTALLEHPRSPLRMRIRNGFLRRALIGLAMGLTAIGLIYSPWGQQSGAHMNPATTLTFLKLGKIAPPDAAFYIGAQFVGGIAGVLVAKVLLRGALTHPNVNYVVTVPGPAGTELAFVAEAGLACGMMSMVLFVTNTPELAAYTGLFAGALVFLFIACEAPLSGMSINPARTAASAFPSGIWKAGWVYFTAPVLGMFLAAQIYSGAMGCAPGACPKLQHGTKQRCIFCGHEAGQADLASRARL
jgi:aquaporin Z